MGILCENIARRANHEDDCKGRFFESRFACRECTDLNALLVCGIYVRLLQWTAKQLKSGQRDTIPADLVAVSSHDGRRRARRARVVRASTRNAHRTRLKITS